MLWTTSCRHSVRSFKTCLGPLKSRSFAQTSHNWFPRPSPRTVKAAKAVPSFREEIAKTSGVTPFSERLGRPTIRKQVAFFLIGSCVAFALAVDQTQFETDWWSKRLPSLTGIFFLQSTTEEMRRASQAALYQKLQARFNKLKEVTSSWPIILQNISLSTIVAATNSYLTASEGRRLCWIISGLNLAIFLVWKIPRLNPFMNRSFMHDPLSGKSYTLLTSMFSHKGFIHLLANSFALTSFGSAATHYFYLHPNTPEAGPEATAKWHFLAFFISAGLFSGLVSHTVATKILYPRLLSEISTQAKIKTSQAASAIVGDVGKAALSAPARKILPSLGASGAIYAAVTVSALAFPDAQVQLIFPPFFPISITTGVGGMILLDLVGAIRGWRLFDHYAHLGGAAFGMFYYSYGNQWWASLKRLYRDGWNSGAAQTGL
ncbi:hypothetical protein HYDPIDRAFT_153072 [Hydnomerulius pinastri MD-312]|uniref:Peptidase S54 rhomboid domain-containing protein n=1 Tax=Hydnomerulius pinastri MD-312 TaxID=994086 RepID=A0A0C9WFU2_9AGAM|nr:hypothetical protein HYDPIDRAFT_153072 [Hydnomerulius pinastri MD-312]